MGYGSNWRKIVSGLDPQTNQILIFDQRGHGRSWKPETGYSSDDYAEDLRLILEELGWDKILLVGHSMGGRNALAFASHYPELLEKLIIEDIGPDSNVGAIDYYKKMLEAVPTPFQNKLQAKEFFMNDWPKKCAELGIAHENILTLGQYLYSNMEDITEGSSAGLVDWRFSKAGIIASVTQGRAKDIWNDLRRLNMPTLIVRGERSKELSRQVFEQMIACNPRVQGVEIANAGHWVHADQSQDFLRVIQAFAE
jgi:pimeloyl-ACP methyl ester carboxylesterase